MASLFPIALEQLQISGLSHRHRKQAPSHTEPASATQWMNTTEPMWEGLAPSHICALSPDRLRQSPSVASHPHAPRVIQRLPEDAGALQPVLRVVLFYQPDPRLLQQRTATPGLESGAGDPGVERLALPV